MNINIVSILEKHLPFIPADLNQRKMKAAISKFQSNHKKNKPLKYTLEQIKAIKEALLTNNCKACIARDLEVNPNLVYEISYGTKYSDV